MNTITALLTATLLLAGLAGCRKTARPARPCVSGRLIGSNCEGSYLIQVDTTAQTPIGAVLDFQGDQGPALSGPAGQRRVYQNVISAEYPPLTTMQRGQQFYFQYQLVEGALIPRACTAAGSTYYNVPQYRLLGISSSSCSALLPE